MRRARNAADRLARPPLGLLRQVPDGGVGGLSDDRALLRRRPRRRACRSSVDLPGAVRPDEPDDVAGGDDQVETGEQDAGAVAGGQAGGLQGRAHQVTTLPARCRLISRSRAVGVELLERGPVPLLAAASYVGLSGTAKPCAAG